MHPLHRHSIALQWQPVRGLMLSCGGVVIGLNHRIGKKISESLRLSDRAIFVRKHCCL